jgi:hypothetical protein
VVGGAEPARAADDGAQVYVGERVRLIPRYGDRDAIVGTVAAADGGGLTLQRKGDTRWSWDAIDTLYVSTGKRTHTREGFVTGALAVGLPFAVLGGVVSTICIDFEADESVQRTNPRDCGRVDGRAVFGGFMVGATFGGLIGAAIGSIPRESWLKVDGPRAPQLSLGVLLQRGGLGMNVGLRF